MNSTSNQYLNSVQLDLEGFESRLPELRKDYRYMTTEEQKSWSEVLLENHLRNSESLNMIKSCASEFIAKRCPKCSKGQLSYKGCKDRYFCPRCAYSYARSRAKIQYEYLKQVAKAMPFDLKLNQIVLTLPQILERMDKKKFVVMVKEFLKQNGVENYAYEIQFTRSRDPLGSERIHAHVLTFNFKYVGSVFEPTEYFFDLVKLRDVWKQVIEKATGETIEGDVDLHNEYASIIYKKSVVLHILSYLYRYPITDLFNAWRKDRSYVQTRQINHVDYFKTKNRLTWCGLLSPHGRRKLESLLGIMLDTLVNIKAKLMEREKKCPDCNVFYVVVDRGKYQGDNEPIRSER